MITAFFKYRLLPLLITLLVCWLPLNVFAENTNAFKLALPGYQYQFPQDHASHPAYKTEWWYYTGHLQDVSNANKRFGYELTFFRSATGLPKRNQSAWQANEFHLVHFAITDEAGQQFHHTAKLNRGVPGGISGKRAGASSSTYHVWNENWAVKQNKHGEHELHAVTPDMSLTLVLSPSKPAVIHGQNGVSQKADCMGCASHYYSYTRMLSKGAVRLNNTTTNVIGQSWMDHEFGSNQLQPKQIGWDWFSVQLDNNIELMLYVLRRKDGTLDPNSSGTWISATGRSEHLNLADFTIDVKQYWQSTQSKGRYPSQWQIQVPGKNLTLSITPVLANQELTDPRGGELSYWEGRSTVAGTIKNKSVTGNAYVEMTGYANAFKHKI